MKTFILVTMVILAVLSGCTGGPAAEKNGAAAAPDEPFRVLLAAAETRRIERAISVTGSLQADEAVTLGSEAAGRLAKVHVDFGQRVEKGQVVAELDQRELELTLERMRASLAQVLARIGLDPNEADVVPGTTPQIRQAQAQLDNARTKHESAAKLVKTGDIANDRYVELEKVYRAAEAALDATRHDLRTTLANIQALRAEVRLAEKRLEDATVRAPFSGSVAERMASPGQFLAKNAPIVRLVKNYPLRLRVDIPESATQAVRIGTTLTFTTDAIAGETFRAIVREVNPSLDARSRSLAAEARLGKHDPRLRPGMFVQVQLVVDRDAEVVAVPREAVHSVAGLTKIFAIREGRAVELKILRGAELDGWVEVRDGGIRSGEAVAVSRVAELTDGAPVTGES